MMTIAACGGGDDPMPPPVPPATIVAYTYDAADPCAAIVPTPNDLFADDSLKSDLSGCALPSDPIEAAIQSVMRNEGAALDAQIRLPLAEGSVKASSLSSTAALSLIGGTGTSSTAPPPPVVLLRRVGTATAATGWQVLAASAAEVDGALVVTPGAPLEAASYYVVVATRSILNEGGNELEPAPLTALLVGAAPIVAGAIEGLDAAAAAKLERERQRLAPIVALLAAAAPSIPAEEIVSIQGFSTRLGFARLEREIEAYQSALARNRFTFEVTTTGGDIDPAELDPRWTEVMMRFGGCPPQQPISGCYDRVAAFRRGTIRVPKVLDENGRLRAGWATTTIETLELPFLASLPQNPGADGYPATVFLPGFGRSKLDARELSNEYASQLGGTVIGLDLSHHGDRTVDPATGQPALEDTMPNNGNPELAGADGIPDRSGEGFLSGDPQALRDQQIAATIEVMHVFETIKQRTAFRTEQVNVNGRDYHLVAQGHSASIATYVAAFTLGIRTTSLPSGGAGVPELIKGAADAERAAFLAGAPEGITAANLDAYLDRLDETVLETISIEQAGALAGERYVRAFPQGPRILLLHGSRPEYVSVEARQRLIAAITLPSSRVSQHRGGCDDFFLFTCVAGESFSFVVGARAQLSTFASSGGMTVLRPAQ